MGEEKLRDGTGRLEISCPEYSRPTAHFFSDNSRVGVSVSICDPSDPIVPKGAMYCIEKIVQRGKNIYSENLPSHSQRVYLDRDGFVRDEAVSRP